MLSLTFQPANSTKILVESDFVVFLATEWPTEQTIGISCTSQLLFFVSRDWLAEQMTAIGLPSAPHQLLFLKFPQTELPNTGTIGIVSVPSPLQLLFVLETKCYVKQMNPWHPLSFAAPFLLSEIQMTHQMRKQLGIPSALLLLFCFGRLQ